MRSSVALHRAEHLTVVRVSGPGAFDAVDAVFTRELYLRDGQLRQGLLLGPDGSVFTDCEVAADAEDFVLVADGSSCSELTAYLARHTSGIDDVEVTALDSTNVAIGIDGPYAWELMAELVGPEVIGLPYLTFFRFDGVLCLRAGKTGEYGYLLLVPRADSEALWSRLLELGRAWQPVVIIERPALRAPRPQILGGATKA